YTGADLEIDEVLVEGSGTSQPNVIQYFLEPETMGFRYLRLISYGYAPLADGILRHPRIVEIDAFTNNSSPYITAVTPTDATFFHPTDIELQFTVGTDGGKVIDPADIELFLNGVQVQGEQL